MTAQIEIISRETEHTLEVRASAAVWKLPMVIGKTYQRIMEYMQERKAEPSCAPFIRYRELDWKKLHYQGKLASFIMMLTYQWKMLIGFPVKNRVEGKDDIEAGSIPKGRYIKALHCGAYQKVGNTYRAILAFAQEKNLRVKSESIEFYLNDPRTTKKEDLKTDVLVPLAE